MDRHRAARERPFETEAVLVHLGEAKIAGLREVRAGLSNRIVNHVREIKGLAVDEASHRPGIGRALVHAASTVAALRADRTALSGKARERRRPAGSEVEPVFSRPASIFVLGGPCPQTPTPPSPPGVGRRSDRCAGRPR